MIQSTQFDGAGLYDAKNHFGVAFRHGYSDLAIQNHVDLVCCGGTVPCKYDSCYRPPNSERSIENTTNLAIQMLVVSPS